MCGLAGLRGELACCRQAGRSPVGGESGSDIETIFGLRYRQRVQCSDLDLPDKIREASNFQVCAGGAGPP